MLVKLVDHKGKDQYINAVYVKAILPKGINKCTVEISGRSSRLRVNMDAASVVDIVNAAMPNSLDAILAAEDQNHTDQMAAAAAATG
ncbi:MAG: hypothetical protein P1U42_03050 [Phycisphaerales bacterium]|jgi:hypothetical protein|nr:hypothetical protein [Phycisphaerales bacterium]